MSNTSWQAVILIKLCQNTFKPSLKRDADILEDERPLKKKRGAFTNKDEDDVDWLKHEISDIKDCLKDIAEHLRGNVEYRLEELRLDIQKWS
jgi:hypothetical protein